MEIILIKYVCFEYPMYPSYWSIMGTHTYIQNKDKIQPTYAISFRMRQNLNLWYNTFGNKGQKLDKTEHEVVTNGYQSHVISIAVIYSQ